MIVCAYMDVQVHMYTKAERKSTHPCREMTPASYPFFISPHSLEWIIASFYYHTPLILSLHATTLQNTLLCFLATKWPRLVVKLLLHWDSLMNPSWDTVRLKEQSSLNQLNIDTPQASTCIGAKKKHFENTTSGKGYFLLSDPLNLNIIPSWIWLRASWSDHIQQSLV